MNSYLYNYINQLIDSSSVSEDSFVYVKNYSNIDLDDFIGNLSIDQSTLCFSHTFVSNKMHSAYEPFMEWIKEIYINNSSILGNDFFEKCNTYSLHKKMFLSYFETGKCERDEDIIIPEISYDRTKLLSDFVNVFNYISSKKNIVIFLNSIHFADSSTYKLLCEFQDKLRTSNIYFILFYNDLYKKPTQFSNDWDRLISGADKTFFYIENTDSISPFANSSYITFKPESSDFDEYAVKINNMIQTLCTDQALFYLNILHNKFEIEQMKITIEQRIVLALMHSITHVYNSNSQAALLFCDKAKSLLNQQPNLVYEFYLNYIVTLAYEYNNNFSFANQTYEECLRLSKIIKDDFITFKTQLLYYICTYLGWQDIYMYQTDKRIEDSFLVTAKKYKFINHLAYIVAFGTKKSDNKNSKMSPVFLHLNEGISYAEEIGNDNFILTAYKEKIYTSSCIGSFEEIEFYQNKCIEILNKMNNPKELSAMYNSLGYNCSVHEDFSTSNKYYNMSIKINIENNYSNIMYEPFYNKSILAVQTMNYDIAIEYLKTSLMFIEELKTEKLRIANKSKLYGLLALCYYYINIDYNCYLYLSKLERYISHLLNVDDEELYFLWDDDLFLFYFIKAVLAKKKNSFDVAEHYFDKAKVHMNRSTENKYFSYPLYAIELSDLYKKQNLASKGKSLLKDAITFCSDNHYSFKYMVLNSIYSEFSFFKPAYDLSLDNIDINQVRNLAKQCGIAKKLEDRNSDINFLSTWKELMLNTPSPTKLIETSIPVLSNNYALDSIYFYSISEDECCNILYNNSDIILTKENFTIINNTLINLTSGIVTSRTDDDFINFKDLLTIFDINNISSILFCPIIKQEKITHVFIGCINKHGNFIDNSIKLSDSTLEIVSFAIRQLVDSINILDTQVYLKDINNTLEHTSITDLLTNVYNRQGMYKIFSKKEKLYNNYYILYVDLDNFKLYNDTFGHDIGDQILIKFSSLLKDCICSDSGYLVRYGGDEFLIIMHGISKEDAISLAESIFSKLKESNYLYNVISEKCTKNHLSLPNNKHLSCSIGIACGNKFDELDTVLQKADSELFKVKKSTKNSYRISDC